MIIRNLLPIVISHFDIFKCESIKNNRTNFTVASLTLVGFSFGTTLAMDSGLDNGLQTVEDRGN